MAKFNSKLLQELSDDYFHVHEATLDENSLFKLHMQCDEVMRSNPKAQHDGGFKIKLPEHLNGTGSTLKDFWSKFPNASQYLACLHLTCEARSPGIMKLHSRRVPQSDGQEFKKAVKNPQTFETSNNCCMQALERGGPKEALIHFYDCLSSKAAVNEEKAASASKSTKTQYYERQAMLVPDDPSLSCIRVERNMRERKYFVQNNSAPSESTQSPASYPSSFEPRNLRQDGDGENCSLYFNCIEENTENFLYITPNFALAHLCHLNMLTDLPQYFAGIAYPFIYLGGLHSVFPIHIEDMSLWSVNYNHFGYPKLIILVAPSEVSRLSLLLTNYGLSWTGKDCIQQLFHKTDIVFPQWLLDHGIKFKVVIQHPGEFTVFAPNAAHTGGNMGPNLAEACNFGSYDWLPFGSVASHGRCDCIESGVQFDVTQLIRDHRPELLPFHKNESMWTSFSDAHFQQSLIIPPTACFASACYALPAHRPSLSRMKPSSSRMLPKSESAPTNITCPVKACGKCFKGNHKSVVSHIHTKHPDCVKDASVKQFLALAGKQ